MSTDAVHVFATITAQPGKAEEVRAALVALVASTRAEEGTVEYELHEDGKNEGSFHFYEVYANRAAFGLHAKSEALKATFGKIGSLLISPPVVTQTKLLAKR